MVNNGFLYTNVMEKLKFEPSIDESNITVAIKDNGIVVLGGTVKSFTEKHLAAEAVERIEKVKGIANEIEVELIQNYKRSDVEIVQAALNSLKWTFLIPYEKIKVEVENGKLTLSGEVEYNFERERVQNAVQDLYGVRLVINNIKIKPKVSPKDVKDKIIKEFERNALIDANKIQVEVDGSKVILKGKIKNLNEDREARTAAWSVPGVDKVIDNLEITW